MDRPSALVPLGQADRAPVGAADSMVSWRTSPFGPLPPPMMVVIPVDGSYWRRGTHPEPWKWVVTNRFPLDS